MYHVMAASVSVVGMLASIYALLGERFKWASFGNFSVATKVPVEIFCVTGPIVMVSFFLYAILAFLLATERGTSTCFHIASFWSMIFTDMSIVLYKEWREIFRRNIDMCLHAVNAVILLYSMLNMPYAPTTFVLMSLGGWGSIILHRVVRSYMEKHRPRLPSRELDRARARENGQLQQQPLAQALGRHANGRGTPPRMPNRKP